MKEIISKLVSGIFGQYVPLTFYQHNWNTQLSIAKLPEIEELPNFLCSYGADNMGDAIGIWFEEVIWPQVEATWESDHRTPIIKVARKNHTYWHVSKNNDPSDALNINGYHNFILKALQSYLRSFLCESPNNIINPNYCAIPYPKDGHEAQRILRDTNLIPVLPYRGNLLTQVLSGNYNYVLQSLHNEYENGPLLQLGLKYNPLADRLLSCVDFNIKRWRLGMMAPGNTENLTKKNRIFLTLSFKERVLQWRKALKLTAAIGLFSLFKQKVSVFSGAPETEIQGIPECVRLSVIDELNQYFLELLGYEAVVEKNMTRLNTLKARHYPVENLLRKIGGCIFPEEPDHSREHFDWVQKVRATPIDELHIRCKNAVEKNKGMPGIEILKV